MKPASTGVRAATFWWLIGYLSWYWLSPWLLERMGQREEAGWVTLFLLPTMALGLLVGPGTIIWPNKFTVAAFALLSVAHLAIGLGFHPK